VIVERVFDVVFSGVAIIVLIPIFVFVALILRVTGEGEIFFTQDRVGKNGKIFKLFKFATMLKDSSKIGAGTITVKDDPRILPIGKILRKTKINELLQLLNIFFGDMSFIGPRPLTPTNFDLYSKETQIVVGRVKPGLSGIGSVVFRNEESMMGGDNSSLTFYQEYIAPYKGSLEFWFVSERNLKVYFITIFLTIWVVIFPKSAIIWRVFEDLPKPPAKLCSALNYPY
jgi:lipopolysaccharide/colanic/teichoic acid biosynthesis glycosyltransferase